MVTRIVPASNFTSRFSARNDLDLDVDRCRIRHQFKHDKHHSYALQFVSSGFGGFILEMPSDLTGDGHEGPFDLDLDGIHENANVPRDNPERARCAI